MEEELERKLDSREKLGSLRVFSLVKGIDFVSNDYLGWSRQPDYALSLVRCLELYLQSPSAEVSNFHGSTGSRVLSGQSSLADEVELELTRFYRAEAGLLFHTGYTANLGLFSCIGQTNQIILYDEFVHASIHDGLRLSRSETRSFKHNDLNDIEYQLRSITSPCLIVVESIYGTDGDETPLPQIIKLAQQYSAKVIVDEAHATGIYGLQGRGKVVEYGLEDQVFARIHTFGKALNAQGAIVVGSKSLKQYILNYARSFIYSTFLPGYQLLAMRHAHQWLQRPETNQDRMKLFNLIDYFKSVSRNYPSISLLPSSSPIQSILVPGNTRALQTSQSLRNKGMDVRALRFPTVPKGTERLRICLHAYNRNDEIERLFSMLDSVLCSSLIQCKL